MYSYSDDVLETYGETLGWSVARAILRDHGVSLVEYLNENPQDVDGANTARLLAWLGY